MSTKKIPYSEPTDFFPKEVRKRFGLGEFNKDEDEPKAKKKSTKAKKIEEVKEAMK